MQENSPYTAPEADISTQDLNETYQPRIFSFSGRIGRLRYLAYATGSYFIIGILAAIIVPILKPTISASSASDPFGGLAVALILLYIPIIIFFVVLAVRRLHDLDKTGWLALVFLIPIVGALFGLYVLFAAGSEESNQYGPKPCANTTGVKIIGLLLPIIALIGIIAAIAIPAYQDYIVRAGGG